jgi:predicted RND superfamily exporter protein
VTTIRSTGPALLITTVTDTAGFATLYFSLIPAIGRFGAMVAAGLFVSFLACLALLPALLMWADRLRGEAEGADVSEAELASLRAERQQTVRAEQQDSRMGEMGAWVADNPIPVSLATLIVLGAVGAPLAEKGVDVWGASYLEPEPILEEDTYAMQALYEMDETFGIPNELAVMFYGDPTDPQVVDYLDEFQTRTNDTHAMTKVDSVPNMLRLYTTVINPDPRIDQDGDGIPDTQEDIRQAYDEMRNDPATKVLLDRVVLYDPGQDAYTAASHRIGIDPQPADSLGEDVDNYRRAIEDVNQTLEAMEPMQQEAGVDDGTTGLVKLGVEVVDAIKRGNAATMAIMVGVVFALLSAFWSSPAIGAIGLVPVLSGMTVQYGLSSALGYEITYVSLILTGMVMGIGVDDAVHFVTRFREEIRRGETPRTAASLANAEVGSVLVGTTVTTLSPFVVVIFSVVTWASQTALLVIPTLLGALLGTLIPLPALLTAHARRRPAAYLRGTVFDEDLDTDELDASIRQD